MTEEVRRIKALLAEHGTKALVGWKVCPEEWPLFSTVGCSEALGLYLPSVNHSGVRYPIESVEVTGRKLHWNYGVSEPRVRVKVTFAAVEGMTGSSTLGWLEV